MPDSLHLPATVVHAFRVAVEAAARFRGATAPNPPVGCVALDGEGRVLAVGAHERAGRPHAEAAALATCRQEGTLERVRTVVVTLEPCNHWGRTPPCSEAILETPARTVWFGSPDIDPRAVGGGARLRAAGLGVVDLSLAPGGHAARLAAACRSLTDPFVKRMRTGRPWVTIKQALDADGSMIPPPGRKTFTSTESLLLAHALRKRADAILTGSGTVLADRPEFTVRHLADHPGKRRLLAVLDRRGRVPADYAAEAAGRGLDLVIERDPESALGHLGERGALEVLVEAGPTLTANLLRDGLWDEHVIIRQRADGQADEIVVRRRGQEPARRFEASGDERGVIEMKAYLEGWDVHVAS